MLEFIKKTIHEELATIAFKLLIGLVLAYAIVFSLTQIGFTIQTLLNPLKNGFIIELFIFSMVAIVCFFVLYLLFKTSHANGVAKKNKAPCSFATFDLQALGIKLAEGMIEGFVSPQKKETKTSEKQS